MSDKFLPHISQIREAAKQLPDAELWPSDEYIVELKGSQSSHLLTFHRKGYLSRSKGKIHKWIYEGKMLVGH